MKKFLFLIITLVATTSLLAYDCQSGDLYYNITSGSKPYTMEVTHKSSTFPYNDGVTLTTATIPETVTYGGRTHSVTSIGDDAFFYCSSLTSVAIPSSVTSIGEYAFCGCLSLKSVTIPNSVTSIGKYAFTGCESLTSVTIPNSVTSIGSCAFDSCTSLTSITIPESVTNIEFGAFAHCTELESVTISNGVKSIGQDAFFCCYSLTSVTIPASVTSIGEGAFLWCLQPTINYLGTKKQWEGIADTNLIIDTQEEIVVHCTDGDVKLIGK